MVSRIILTPGDYVTFFERPEVVYLVTGSDLTGETPEMMALEPTKQNYIEQHWSFGNSPRDAPHYVDLPTFVGENGSYFEMPSKT